MSWSSHNLGFKDLSRAAFKGDYLGSAYFEVMARAVLNLPPYAALTDAGRASVVAFACAPDQDVSGLAPPSIARART